MKCPDCSRELVQTEIVGMDSSYRCTKCGGVWIQAWVINKLAESESLKISEGTKPETIKSEKRICPSDGSVLTARTDPSLPADTQLWVCAKCKLSWMPGNSIFDLLKAFVVKNEYTRRWTKKGPILAFTMPVILTVILAVGLVAGLVAFNQAQQLQIKASSPILGKISVMYLGDEKAEIRFKAGESFSVAAYKRDSDQDWQPAYVVSQGDWKVIRVEKVRLQDKLMVLIDNYLWTLTVGQRQ